MRRVGLSALTLKLFILRFIMRGGVPAQDSGISEGGNLSAYLGNFVLDGLQSCIYLGLKDSRKKDDYADENTIRFADDVIVTVRSKKKAQMHCGIFVRARQLIIALPMHLPLEKFLRLAR